MALRPSKREDLLRDATQYGQRVRLQFQTSDRSECVFIGFRRQGGWSVYFDEDPVWQFNAAGELRRAFVDGQRIAACRGQLERLTRCVPDQTRNPDTNQSTDGADHSAAGPTPPQRLRLQAVPISAVETDVLRERCHSMLTWLQSRLQAGDTTSLEQIPEAPDSAAVTEQLIARIQQTIESGIRVANSPAA